MKLIDPTIYLFLLSAVLFTQISEAAADPTISHRADGAVIMERRQAQTDGERLTWDIHITNPGAYVVQLIVDLDEAKAEHTGSILLDGKPLSNKLSKRYIIEDGLVSNFENPAQLDTARAYTLSVDSSLTVNYVRLVPQGYVNSRIRFSSQKYYSEWLKMHQTTDIGGFHGGDPDSPYFRELIVRWFQYAVFCPLFRLHGFRNCDPDAPNEVWSFGETAYGHIKTCLAQREQLRPYIKTHMQVASETGLPMMRPLLVDFHDDPEAWGVEDQFMFGPDILVAPVVQEGVRARRVYLPHGTAWIDAATQETHEGGQYLDASAPLDHIPVYLRKGSVTPILGRKPKG